MKRFIVPACVATLVLATAALLGGAWLKGAMDLPNHADRSSNASRNLEILQFPLRSSPRPPPRVITGLWLGAFETNHFQPQGSDGWYWLTGNAASVWDLYRTKVLEPQKRAAKYGLEPPDLPPSYLCVSLAVVGVLHPEPANATFGEFEVERVLSAEPVDLPEEECLR